MWEGLAINPPLSVYDGGFLKLMGQKVDRFGSTAPRGRRGANERFVVRFVVP